jgi:hypothetical protein
MIDNPEYRYRNYGSRIAKELKTPRRSFASLVGKACLLLLLVALYLAVAFVISALVVPVKARAQEDNCQGGAISTNCCCTNNCCRSIPSTDIVPVGPDEYLIVASGQTIKRTGWSPDGTIIRCACDKIDGKWIVYPKAHTRCLYLPMPNS